MQYEYAIIIIEESELIVHREKEEEEKLCGFCLCFCLWC